MEAETGGLTWRGTAALAALVIALAAVQAWFSAHSTAYVLDEELAESIRNPLWVQHRLVYDGVSSNVGWYALMAAVHRVFGFSLFSAKLVRLSFAAAALLSLAHLLGHFLG